MRRRDLLTAIMGAAVATHAQAQGPDHELLPQGPFTVEQDSGWQTIFFSTPSDQPLRNPGLGLVGYTWEEGGPALAVRAGRRSLEQQVEQMAALPFVDVLYIRCDWRNVQKTAGRLGLDPVWGLTLDAAKRHGLRVAFRVQLSNPGFQPERLALPDFVASQVPLAPIGNIPGATGQYHEPRYDHPAFQRAFAELNDLLAARFDGDPLIEWVDLMQYGFWGEGHTSDYPNPFPDFNTAVGTSLAMTQQQLSRWKRTPLAVNTQPDISRVGNDQVLELAMRAGAWLRSDSVVVEEPQQVAALVNRPATAAAVLEDGYFRKYDVSQLERDAGGVNVLENYMLHVLDLGANYWSLWTEAENLARYNQRYPKGFQKLRARMGYRVRPAWVWQRKRDAHSEVIVGLANQGVAGVPGVLWLSLESLDGKLKMRGALEAGQPHAGGVHSGAFLLPKDFTGRVRLRAELETRPGSLRPVAFACEQPAEFDVKPWDDHGWRKGV